MIAKLILVIDDCPVMRRLAKLVLQTGVFKRTGVEVPDSPAELDNYDGEDVSLVVTDIVMNDAWVQAVDRLRRRMADAGNPGFWAAWTIAKPETFSYWQPNLEVEAVIPKSESGKDLVSFVTSFLRGEVRCGGSRPGV